MGIEEENPKLLQMNLKIDNSFLLIYTELEVVLVRLMLCWAMLMVSKHVDVLWSNIPDETETDKRFTKRSHESQRVVDFNLFSSTVWSGNLVGCGATEGEVIEILKMKLRIIDRLG